MFGFFDPIYYQLYYFASVIYLESWREAFEKNHVFGRGYVVCSAVDNFLNPPAIVDWIKWDKYILILTYSFLIY